MKMTRYILAFALAVMANGAQAQAISALPAATALAGTEVTAVVQSSTTKKATIDQIKTWTSNAPTLVTPALGTPASGNFSTGTFTWPTFNQSTTGSAATLTTTRAIYGNNFDGSAALTQIIASTFGGTGNGFTKFSGPTTAERTFTLPDADATILYSGGALGTPSGGTLTNASGLPSAGITMSTARLLGRTTASSGAAEEITVGSGLSLSAGALTATGGSVAVGDITGLGTGVATALAVNVGSAGAPVVNGGALGTPSSGTLTNATGLPAAGVVGTAATLGANTFTALQTITQASANAGILASTGYSLTGTNATGMVSLAGTLNTTGNPDVFKIAVTDTASGSSTNLFRVYGAASGAYPHFTIAKSGNVTFSAASGGTAVEITAGGDIRGARYRDDTNQVAIGSYSTAYGVIVKNTGGMNWSADSTWYGTTDTFLTRGGAAATVQLGAAAAASPVAQTLQSQPSRAGTDTNVAGANLTTRPGAGTGNSTPASYIIQTYVPVASGTGAQTATAALTLDAALTLGSHIVTPASSGTRYLCISTAGVVTSSASACSGT